MFSLEYSISETMRGDCRAENQIPNIVPCWTLSDMNTPIIFSKQFETIDVSSAVLLHTASSASSTVLSCLKPNRDTCERDNSFFKIKQTIIPGFKSMFYVLSYCQFSLISIEDKSRPPIPMLNENRVQSSFHFICSRHTSSNPFQILLFLSPKCC